MSDSIENQTENLSTEPTPEVKSPTDILVAEHLAYAQVELDHRITAAHDGLASAPEIIDTLIEKYPDIVPYRQLFDGAIEYLGRVEQDTNNFWRQHVSPNDELSEGVIFPELPYPEANAQASKELAESLFGLPFSGDIHAINDRLFLLFLINPNDFRKIETELLDDHESSARFTIFQQLPVVIIKDREDADYFLDRLHEGKHAFDRIIEAAISQQIIRSINRENDSVSLAINTRLIKNQITPSAQETAAKNEIMAYFTQGEWQDIMASLTEEEPTITSDQIRGASVELINSMLPGGEYHDPDDPTLRNGHQAVEAFISLRELYMKSNEAWLADRIVVALLSQFPLKTWPAVSRMIKGAHALSPVKPAYNPSDV